MDVLLLAHPNKKYLQKVIDLLPQDIASLKLMVAPKKVQRMPPFSFLGVCITKDIQPLTFKLSVKINIPSLIYNNYAVQIIGSNHSYLYLSER